MSNTPRYHPRNTPTINALRCRNQSGPLLFLGLSALLEELMAQVEASSFLRLWWVNKLTTDALNIHQSVAIRIMLNLRVCLHDFLIAKAASTCCSNWISFFVFLQINAIFTMIRAIFGISGQSCTWSGPQRAYLGQETLQCFNFSRPRTH